MKKTLLLVFIFFSLLPAFAQKVTQVELLQSSSFIGMKRNGENTQKVLNPVFRQDNATLTCDSAYFYIERNMFDAFGNVHINQADTINIYSNLLNYNGNTKQAVLTDNVRMIDKNTVLTTNNLDYNMASKVGRYTNGGKIVNDNNTLTSKNGYYFSNSRDAYFRYNVVLKSPEALVKSDTLKYNTASKISYFYGPTNIYGKKDTLYTENGQYNTVTDQAAFGKKNLYRQNSKTLKGDSLFYDKKAGYGRAVKNIVFKDTLEKVELRGDLGVYLTKDESITVTKKAYVVLTTEKDSVSRDSIWMTADTLKSRVLMKKDLYLLKKQIETAAKIKTLNDSLSKKKIGATDSLNANSITDNDVLLLNDSIGQADSLKQKPLLLPSDSRKKMIDDRSIKKDTVSPSPLNTKKITVGDDRKRMIDDRPIKKDTISPSSPTNKKITVGDDRKRMIDDRPIKKDSLQKIIPDTKLKTGNITDTIKTTTPKTKKQLKAAARLQKKNKREAINTQDKAVKDSVKKAVKTPQLSKTNALKTDSLKIDSIPVESLDTAKIRVVSAYRKVKVYKSDMQAIADSAFFSYGDSTLRIYQKPMVWAQGSQFSADTMYIQMKNKKIDNMELIRNSIVVNTEKDSLKFNQVAGKKMKGYFVKDKLHRVFVDGNAESIFYPKDSSKNEGMIRNLAARMRLEFDGDSLSGVAFLKKPEHKFYPIAKLTEELKTLPNFTWKPKDRPISKEQIIPSLVPKKVVIKKPFVKPALKKPLTKPVIKVIPKKKEPPLVISKDTKPKGK